MIAVLQLRDWLCMSRGEGLLRHGNRLLNILFRVCCAKECGFKL